MVAAAAVGANEVVLYVKRSDPRVWAAVLSAVDERRAAGERGSAVRLVAAPSSYVSGQETARDRPYQRQAGAADDRAAAAVRAGRRQSPDLHQQRRDAGAHGADRAPRREWFRALGSPTQPGSVLVTLGGAVVRPGVYEIAFGSRLTDLLRAAGGVSERPQALLVGGYGGAWLDARHMERPHVDRGRSAARRRLDRSRRPLGPRRGLVRGLGVRARARVPRRSRAPASADRACTGCAPSPTASTSSPAAWRAMVSSRG